VWLSIIQVCSSAIRAGEEKQSWKQGDIGGNITFTSLMKRTMTNGTPQMSFWGHQSKS